MSYPIHVYVVCEKCGHKFKAVVETRINGLVAGAGKPIADETLNMIKCPSCKHSSRAKFPVFYDNVYAKSGVWYRPCVGRDDFYKKTKELYTDERFLQPEKIETTKDWKEFKEKTDKITMLAAFSMGFAAKTSKEMADYFTAGAAYEIGITLMMEKELLISKDEPEYTLKDGSCIYTGSGNTAKPVKKNAAKPRSAVPAKKVTKTKVARSATQPTYQGSSVPPELRTLLIIAGVIFLIALLASL